MRFSLTTAAVALFGAGVAVAQNAGICYDGGLWAYDFHPYRAGRHTDFTNRQRANHPDHSKYDTEEAVGVPLSTLDSTDQSLDIVWPVGTSEGQVFPTIVYMHGNVASPVLGFYSHLLHDIASYGFVVVAPRSCRAGCEDTADVDRLGPLDPVGYGEYWKEAHKTLDWLESGDAALDDYPIKFGSGWGIAGHSMGGQAAAFACAKASEFNYDVRACVLHNPYHSRVKIPFFPYEPVISDVPTLIFSGTNDIIALPLYSRNIFNAATVAQKSLVITTDTVHNEPLNSFYSQNERGDEWQLGRYTVGWMKKYLVGDGNKLWTKYFYRSSAGVHICRPERNRDTCINEQ